MSKWIAPVRACALCLFVLGAAAAVAEVKLPAIFSDHMVLQKSAKVPVWGTAAPNEQIKITLNGQTVQATADAAGKWKAVLNLEQAAEGPHEMQVAGTNQLTIKDVLIGEVWVASGQSNMEWMLALTTDAPAELAKPANPRMREFKVARNIINEPQADCKGQWLVANPETIRSFSAVGYYYAMRLQQELNTPVGIINTSFGGTNVETWISLDSIKTEPALMAGRAKVLQSVEDYPQSVKNYEAQCQAWLKKYGREDKAAGSPAQFATAAATGSDWKTVTLPTTFKAAGLPEGCAVWLTRRVPITPDRANQEIRVQVGVVRDYCTAYWNGVKLEELPLDGAVTQFKVPPTPVGEALLAVRVYSPYADGSIDGNRGSLRVGNNPDNMFDLTGKWQARVETELPALTPAALAEIPKFPGAPPRPQNVASSLFNGMVNPLIPFAIRGAIWYQGESNVPRAEQYKMAFALLINDWRKQWGQGVFPFYFCQLANFEPKKSEPGDSKWAELREAQTATLAVPGTGQAILIDIGEERDIHPRMKKEAADRLARVALVQTYGKKIPCYGPSYESMEVQGDKIRLRFAHVEQGLVARPLPSTYQPQLNEPATKPLVLNSPDSELEGFAICGADRQWHWANAKIEGQQVVVWSPAVAQPAAVRYAWADNPTCNLYNSAGLPAVPFRTDTFDLSTKGVTYAD